MPNNACLVGLRIAGSCALNTCNAAVTLTSIEGGSFSNSPAAKFFVCASTANFVHNTSKFISKIARASRGILHAVKPDAFSNHLQVPYRSRCVHYNLVSNADSLVARKEVMLADAAAMSSSGNFTEVTKRILARIPATGTPLGDIDAQ
jgi:hypothetical protein